MRQPTRCSTSGWCLTLLASIVFSLLTASPASSQTVPSVEAGKPFKVAFDHDGANTTHFRLLLNGRQILEVPVTASVGGVVTLDMAPLAAGSYQLIAVARNAPTAPFTDPTEAASVAYAFEARVKAPTPNPPAWRMTVLLVAGQPPIVESVVPVDAPQVLRLLTDGTARVE